MAEQALTSGVDPTAAAAAAAALAASSDDGETGEDQQQDDARRQAAIKQGWKEKEHYDGDPEEWVDHSTFLDRAQQINPILRAKNARLEQALERLERKVSQQEQTIDGWKRNTVADTKRNLEADLIRLRTERSTAISDADGDKVNELDDKIYDARRKLETLGTTEGEGITTPNTNDASPELREAAAAFVQQYKDWYGTDKYRTGVAHITAAEVAEDSPHLLNKPAFFTEVARRVNERLGLRDMRGSIVDGGGGGGNGSGRPLGGAGKSYNSLPADAKETCDKQVSQGLWKDRAEFAKYYFEDEERDKERGR
jgi:uncharacterized coiled-coil protein SlyX